MPALKICRSIEINRDAAPVFDALRDFASWNQWSPWLLADSAAKVTVNDRPADVDGQYAWDSDVVGAGSMQHRSLSPPGDNGPTGTIVDTLRFTKPWQSESEVRFEVAPSNRDGEAPKSTVKWFMDGSLPWFLFWMRGRMESMIAMDYDRGLRMLKEWIETGTVASKTHIEGLIQFPSQTVIGLRGHCHLSDIGRAMENTIGEASDRLAKAGIETDGGWMSIYNNLSLSHGDVQYTSGVLVPADHVKPDGLVTQTVPATSAVHVTHVGKYEHLGNAWFAAYQNARAMQRKVAAAVPGFEIYETLSPDTPSEQAKTNVYLPVK